MYMSRSSARRRTLQGGECRSRFISMAARGLRVLEVAGLLTHEKQGRMRIYRIQRKRLELVRDWLAHFSKNSKHKEKQHAGETPGQSK